jgi:hypothetical protein
MPEARRRARNPFLNRRKGMKCDPMMAWMRERRRWLPRMLPILALLFYFMLPALAQAGSPHEGVRDKDMRQGGAARTKNGVLVLPLAGGRTRRYEDNLRFDHGTLVRYHYRGHIPKIDAHIVEIERMGVQIMLVSRKTGRETAIGGLYVISPDGHWIFSSDCQETFCYYNVIDWTSGNVAYEKRQSRETGLSNEKGPFLLSPVKRGTVRWKSSDEIAFAAVCDSQDGTPRFSKVVLTHRGKSWRQSRGECAALS